MNEEDIGIEEEKEGEIGRMGNMEEEGVMKAGGEREGRENERGRGRRGGEKFSHNQI
jgi:hypothetical protein